MHTNLTKVYARPTQVFLNTLCGKKTVHVLANESKKLGLLIQRLFMRNVEIDEMLQLLRGVGSV